MPNIECREQILSEEYREVARPFAIYADNRMIGFTMFAFDFASSDLDDRYWLWRFMIDKNFQGKGYGSAALQKVIEYFRSDETYPALYLYSGTVFKQLELLRYKEKEHEYLSKHLNIMSAYYGVLNYNSAISPYRLDMTMKPNNINLYDYWYTPVYQYFQNEDFIISLASKEFTTMIKHPDLYFIDFVEIKDTKEVRNSMIIKKLRGQMLNYMILHNITTLDELKNIELDNYIYNNDMSTHNTIVFSKKK